MARNASRTQEDGMKAWTVDAEGLTEAHAIAIEKARMWADRAEAAHKNGRTAHARRCEDKSRDWWSRARLIERRIGGHKRNGEMGNGATA
jgi:hypothetical protein